MMQPKHFLDLDHFDEATLRAMLDAGNAVRNPAPSAAKPLAGKVLACIFEKPSTRTRISFDVGMKQLGGDVVVMTPAETQLGRGETIADTARVLSRYANILMLRTGSHQKLLELAYAQMHFGKYKGVYLSDIPEPYYVWFRQKGFPQGKLGDQMQQVYELKVNSLEGLLRQIRMRYPRPRK